MGKVIQASGVVYDHSVPLQLNGHFSAVGMQLSWANPEPIWPDRIKCEI